MRDFTGRLKRNPTQDELAAGMGLNPRQWSRLLIDLSNFELFISLRRGDECNDKRMTEALYPPHHSPYEVAGLSEARRYLKAAKKTLPKRYRQVIRLYYERDLKMKEIGEILGVQESRVSQIHTSALQMMQFALRSKGIRPETVF